MDKKNMLTPFSEQQMHRVRFLLTICWLLLIASLFYDPISPWLTDPSNTLSPLHLSNVCVKLQTRCVHAEPYALGAPIFWGIVIPVSIVILLVGGHEAWRRVCPLSFLSQIPRSLGWQRQLKRVDSKTNKTRLEVPRIKQDSWLGRNHSYLQFGLFYLGLCSRLLFIDANRLALGLWLLGTIVAAIAIGYLYGGKTWCHYFCPMAPVQQIYAEPGGLLTSKAHISDRKITQSMCRTIEVGKEQSTCVACKSSCMDIDAERGYWERVMQPAQKFLYYSYVGLVIGFFLDYRLFAGNWDFYFSGAWARRSDEQLTDLLQPGFFLLDRAIPIPKLIAVPLFLALFSVGGCILGCLLEKAYKLYFIKKSAIKKSAALSPEEVQHRLFTVCTVSIFNYFFIFAGRPIINHLPLKMQWIWNSVIFLMSALWFYQTWQRSPEIYAREKLATQFHRQLIKRNLNISEFLSGRSVKHLKANEIYTLAEALPGFKQNQELKACRAVLRELLEETNITAGSQLKLIQLVLYRKTLATLLQIQIDASNESIEKELLTIEAIIQEQKQTITSPLKKELLTVEAIIQELRHKRTGYGQPEFFDHLYTIAGYRINLKRDDVGS
jgi:4Fe-4S binding domain